MSLYKKYDLLEVLRDDGVKTFQGKEMLTGRPVEIHLLVGETDAGERPPELIEQVGRLKPEDAEHIVETGRHLGTPYVVTLPLVGFGSLREWIETKLRADAPEESKAGYDPLTRVGRWKVPPPARPPDPAPAALEATRLMPSQPPAPPVPKPADAPGDFTHMFQTARQPVSAPDPAGEFTQLFQAPQAPAQMPAGESTRQFPTAPPAATPAGEFTQLFQTTPPPAQMPVGESTRQVPTAPPAATPAGEFTQLFQATQPPAQMPAGESTRQFPTAPPAATPAGEFTQLFQAPQPPAAAQPPSSPGSAGEFTQLFRAPAPAAPASPPPSSPAPQGGEFTRMFETPSSPVPSSTLRMPAAAPAVQPSPHHAQPGEFTAMFNAAPAPVSQQAQGEANRMFQPAAGNEHQVPFAAPSANALGQPAPVSQSPFAAHLPVNPAVNPGPGFGPAKPPSVQDDYAKLFGGGPAPAQAPTGGAGGSFGATNAFPVPQYGQSAPAQAGPSEYTRMFARPDAPAVPAPAPAPVAAPVAAPKRPVWLFVLLGVIFAGLLIGLAVTLLK